MELVYLLEISVFKPFQDSWKSRVEVVYDVFFYSEQVLSLRRDEVVYDVFS